MAFPTTPVLDNFTGTNGDDLPVYSANWQATPTGGAPLEIQSNAATGTSAGGNNTNSWATSFGPDCEVYVTISTVAAAGNVILLFARGVQTGSLATVDGYVLRYAPAAGTDTLTIQSVTNGTQTSIGAAFSQEISAGDSIGLECVGTTLTCYYKPSGGAWGSLFSRTDSTYTAAGQIALFSTSTGVRFDAFGGGNYAPERALTGQSITSSVGSFGLSVSYALTGQQITSSIGSLTGNVSSALTGQSITSIQGDLADSVEIALTGQQITSSQGAITYDSGVTRALTGQEITSSIGSLGVSVDKALTGQSITSSQGSLSSGVSYTLTGQSATLSQGTLAGNVSIGLTGQEIISQQGDITSSGDVTRALVGQSMTMSLGTISVENIPVPPEPPNYLSAGGGGGGVDYDKERKKKQRVREMVEQALNELDNAPVYVQEVVKKEAVKYVEEQLEYNTIDETKIEHIIQLINDYQLKLIIKEHDDIATRILLLH
jgi:hypothetical protein